MSLENLCGTATLAEGGWDWVAIGVLVSLAGMVLVPPITAAWSAYFQHRSWRKQWQIDKEHERKFVATAFYREVELILKALESLMVEKEDYRASVIQIREFEDYTHIYRNNTEKIGVLESDVVIKTISFYAILLTNFRISHGLQESMRKHIDERAKSEARKFVKSLNDLVDLGQQLLKELKPIAKVA